MYIVKGVLFGFLIFLIGFVIYLVRASLKLSVGTMFAREPGWVLSEIDSLEAGFTPASHHLDEFMREEFVHPQPLDSLRARATR